MINEKTSAVPAIIGKHDLTVFIHLESAGGDAISQVAHG